MNRLFSASRSSSQFVSSKAKMSINKVSHVIFDMDGLLLGKIFVFYHCGLHVPFCFFFFFNFIVFLFTFA